MYTIVRVHVGHPSEALEYISVNIANDNLAWRIRLKLNSRPLYS